MTLILSTVLLVLGAAAAAVAVVAVVARFSDGPIGPFAGGPFRSGHRIPGIEVDWLPLVGTPDVELQLINPPRSRTTHVVVVDGQAYVPAGIVRLGPFVLLGQAFWKRWPYEALADPRVILRSDGKLYEARAIRVTDPELHRALSALMSVKYHLDLRDIPDPEKVWFFRLEPGGARVARCHPVARSDWQEGERLPVKQRTGSSSMRRLSTGNFASRRPSHGISPTA